MDKARILQRIVDIGSIKSGMDKDFSGNIFNNTIMAFTDSILMLMFRGSISSTYFVFGCPIFKNGRFEFSTSVRVYTGDGMRRELGDIISNKMSERVNDIRAGFSWHTIHCDETRIMIDDEQKIGAARGSSDPFWPGVRNSIQVNGM